MFGRGGGRARIVARSEVRPRAALFRPEGEKRPLICLQRSLRAVILNLLYREFNFFIFVLFSFTIFSLCMVK